MSNDLKIKILESEEKFKLLTEQSLMGIGIAQRNKFKYINKAYADMFGYTVEEMMNWELKDGIKAIHPEDRAFALEQLSKKQKGDKNVVTHYQYRGIKKSGQIIWVDQFSRAIMYEGDFADLITLIDITTQKETERLLVREKEFFETALNSQEDTFFVFDPSTGKAIRWNKAFSKASGYTNEEISKLKAPKSYYSKSDLLIAAKAIEKIKNEGTAILEMNLITKDGDSIPFEYLGTSIKDENGNLKYIVSIGRDIRERKKAERKLKESEKKLRKIIETIPDLYFLVDKNGTHLDFKGNENLLYLKPEKFLGKTISETLPRNVAEKYENAIKKTLQTKIPTIIEYSLMIRGNLKFYEARNLYFSKNCVAIFVRDITERKEAERELRESEEKFRIMTEQSAAGITIIQNRLLKYANDKFISMTGYTKEELYNFKQGELINLVHPEDRKRILEKSLEHQAGTSNKTVSESYRLLTKDGEVKYIQGYGRTILFQNNPAAMSLDFDVTEKKKADQKLRYQAELVENVSDAIISTDTDFNIKSWNRAAEKIYGWEADEVIGKNVMDTITVEYPYHEQEAVVKQFFEEGFWQGEVIQPHKNGTPLNIYSSVSLIKDDAGSPIGAAAINRDITEQKKVEQKLKKSEEKFRTAVKNSPDFIVFIKKDGTIFDVNRLEKGFTRDMVIGQSVLNENFYETKEQCESARKAIRGSPESGKINQYEYSQRAPDGSLSFYETKVAPFEYDDEDRIKSLQLMTRDITDRKKAELKLKESENLFRNLFETITEGIILINMNGQIVQANPAAEHILGLTRSSIEERNYISPEWEILRPDSTPMPPNEMAGPRAMKEKKPVKNIIMGVNRPDGTISWINVSAVPLLNENKEISGVVGMFTDITERKKAEEELKKFKSISDNANYGIGIIDVEGKLVYTNDYFASIHGYKPYELAGKDFSIFHNENQLERVMELKQKLLTAGSYAAEEVWHTHRDGSVFPMLMNGITIYDDKGNPLLMAATAIDISERQKTEQKLKESEQKYHLLFDNSPIGIGLSTLEGEVVDSNDAMVNLTGYTAEDLNKIGATSIYVDPNVRSKVLKELQEVGKLHDYEVKLRRKDNSEFYGLVSFDLIELDGKKIIQTSLRDISERKNAELELIKLNHLKSEILRRTSHELKTPLVSIKGFSDLLLEVHRGKLDAYVISTLNEIKRGCLRLETLIGDILKTAELESGSTKLHKSEEDLSFLIRLCVQEIKGLSILRNQTLKLDIHDSLMTRFEKEQVHQVVSNLLSNSVKYTPRGGVIEIKSEIKDEFIIISIKDNGIGFAEEEKTKIFKQFGKIERYGKGMDIIPEGSGLGLYISKKIIELHGGDIWVKSEGRNKGSTFYFSLPLNNDSSVDLNSH